MRVLVQLAASDRAGAASQLEPIAGLCSEAVDGRIFAAYRFVAGLCLAGFCAEQAHSTSAVLGWLGQVLAVEPEQGSFASLLSAWVSRPNPTAFWCGSAVASVLLAVGIWPRVLALLLTCALIAAMRVLKPVVQFDDSIATFGCSWLCLLPVGPRLPTVQLEAAGPHRTHLQASSELTLRIFLACIGLVYCNLGFWERRWLGWSEPWLVRVLLCSIPALMLLPTRHPLRCLGAVSQVGLQLCLSLHEHFSFSVLLLSASSILFMRHELTRALGTSALPPKTVLDARAACALVYACTVIVFIACRALAIPVSMSAAATLLNDVGADPELFVFGRVEPFRPVTVDARELTHEVRSLPDGACKRLLVSQLSARPWRELPVERRRKLRARLVRE